VRNLTRAALLVGLCWQAPMARADVKPHGLFTEGMVLQQKAKVPIWGTAAPDEEVKVWIRGGGDGKSDQGTGTAAGKDGRWTVFLDNLRAGGPYTLTISGKNRIELKDVYVGEVWLCSGQSNMQWSMAALKTKEGDADIQRADNKLLRLFSVARVPAGAPQRELPVTRDKKTGAETVSKWEPTNPRSVAGFSATAYYFGRDLQKALKVPVGLIHSSVGGTPAERWTSRAAMDADPELAKLKGNDLYNGMIAPLVPYAIKGAIWYQGESNAGRHAQYDRLMTALIKNWRDDWKLADMPFLFVQLAPYDRANPKGSWPLLREAQLLTSLKVPHTAMAVITDAGHPTDIHPRLKEPVGARLALAARGVAYGEKIVYSGPLYKGMKVEGDKAVLSFDHVGSGLVAKGTPLTGFTIAGADGKFVKGEASIVENQVVVTSPEVRQPMAVRYGWEDHPVCNLYNLEGLPASPFRSDMPRPRGAGAR
jgi:sialate O-acetylesterase